MPEAHTDTVYSAPGGSHRAAAAESWWERYRAAIGNLSSTALEVLETDCRYIVERGIFGNGAPDPATWPMSRVRRGLVMGSVQSGKTASMLGSAAMSMDAAVDIVVVLAGTRLSLWQQTLDRIAEQLDAGPDSSARSRRRLLVPTVPPTESVPTADRYRIASARARRMLGRGAPTVIVALKHPRHIQEVSSAIAQSVFPEVAALSRPVHMLVIDDEADDGSVLDAAVEAGLDPSTANLKQIPRAIADLWSPPTHAVPENFFATYVGYTATPQANFLQDELNPLFPRDFLVALRTPLDRGQIEPRSSTYTEPRGLSAYYTGGETYYTRGREAELCMPTAGTSEDLADALRGFLVAAAIRTYRDGDRLGPASSAGTVFASKHDAKDRAARPCSMLVHPSASKGEHFDTAAEVLVWAGAESHEAAHALIVGEQAPLPAAIADRLIDEEPLWAEWIERYRRSASAIHREFNTPAAAEVPAWPVVKEILRTEVFPGTRVSVVNSDPEADDRPEYDPVPVGDHMVRAGRDLSTIFVSGNVMSRGLTLEGLTTTLFLRRSDRPLADTQMQMQRWFGYRGSHIELCRVFAAGRQLDYFLQYHEVDEALRNVVAATMSTDSPAPTPVVLQGGSFTATGKIANLGTAPLHPGRKPFITVINNGYAGPDPNADLVREVFSSGTSSEVESASHAYGRILDTPLSLADAADFLDRLSFDRYRPGVENWKGELWSQLESRVAAVQPIDGDRLYRPPNPLPGTSADDPRMRCPYSIAAYLRLWEACLTRRVRGLFVTGERVTPWAVTDLTRRAAFAPRFWIGVRYGSGGDATGVLSDLHIPATAKAVENGELRGTWGANNPAATGTEFRGDEFFDYFHRGEVPPRGAGDDEAFRPAGADGQILFYINQHADQTHPAVGVGVCVPLGGPDQFAAYVQAPA